MKALIVTIAATLALVGIAGAARGGPTKPVDVYVAVPANALTTVTPDQAVQMIQAVMGQPTDAPCIGSQSCTVEGWFRHELGKVFDYTIQTIPMAAIPGPADACGSWSAPFLFKYLEGTSIGLEARDRSMVLMLGAGGWAGHYSPADRKVDHFGMVGDWGVMEMFDARNACVPEWDYPARGFSHEFAGMMGAYVTAGYNEGGLFSGDVMSANIKRDLQKYSGNWLRSP